MRKEPLFLLFKQSFISIITVCAFSVSCFCYAKGDGLVKGVPQIGMKAIRETVASIKQRAKAKKRAKKKKIRVRQRNRIQRKINKASPLISQFPLDQKSMLVEQATRAPQAIGLNFEAASLQEVGVFPPDSMGAVGPTQFILAINDLIRSFDKTTGNQDGIFDIDTDTFFDLVSDGNPTTDPRIRYDRMSDRWFIVMVTIEDQSNRLLIAVSDSGVITDETIFFLYSLPVGLDTNFDYPTLGIDAHALYIGGLTLSDSDTGEVFVIRKNSLINGGPVVFTTFHNLINPSTDVGPYVPQGVDNFDANATDGFFIAVDNAAFGRLILRRISNPGGTPSISPNIAINVPMTQFPITVNHLGNTGGLAGRLDGIDDRLMCAHIRNGKLWTVHNVGVNNQGASDSVTRNGSRWYQLDMSTVVPQVIQVGTLFNPTSNNTTSALSYWMPSLMTSGQEYMALGCSVAGSSQRINVASAGRLASQGLGNLQNPTLLTNSQTAYNPPDDPGDQKEGRRWGDYSYTSLDPCDDMTMWTVQEFCDATNSWGVQATQLKAPPPATPIEAKPKNIRPGRPSVNVTVTGQSIAGSGFFDPGVSFDCRLKAKIGGGVTVNSVTYVNPTTIVLNISTVGAPTGNKKIVVTNPDGQKITVRKFIKVRIPGLPAVAKGPSTELRINSGWVDKNL